MSYKRRVHPVPAGAKVIATYPICNFGGVEILAFSDHDDISEYVEVATVNGDERNYMGLHKVYMTKQGRAFFRMYGLVYYLDNFQRHSM